MAQTSLAVDPPSAQTSTGDALLVARRLSKRFPIGGLFGHAGVRALTDVSFTLARGKIIALVGESGSGKSTAAKVVARLYPPSSGALFFKGRNVLEAEKRASLAYRGAVQMIFQDPFGSLNPIHTIGHHLNRPLLIHHKARRGEVQDRAEALLESVGLTPGAEMYAKYPHELSGGQRQRVAIARALAVEPEVILADEPISMLDVSIRMGVLNLMRRLTDQRGISWLYITHDVASARYVSDDTIVMYAGWMVEGGPAEAVIQEAAHPYTRLLLSAVPDPAAGKRKGQVEGRGEPPSLIDPPPGCPFAPRCPAVLPVCREAMPGVSQLGGGHWTRCHLYGAGGDAVA